VPGLDAALAVHLHEDAVTPFATGTVARGGTLSAGDVTSVAKCRAAERLDAAALCASCSSVVRDSTWRSRAVSSAACAASFRDVVWESKKNLVRKSLWINKMRVYVCGQGLLAYLSLSRHHGRVGGPHSDTVFVRWWTILILDRTRQPPERRFVMPARARQASDARIHTSRTPCRGITRVRKVVGTRPGVWQGGHSAIAIPASAERV
jgi:hypothetical protein